MISAFGVEHGQVSKSLVGGVFKPASALTRAERGAVGGYKKARGVSAGDRAFQAEQAKVKEYHAGMKPARSFSSKSGTTHVYEHGIMSRALPKGSSGVMVREGGKRGTSHVHYQTSSFDTSTSAKSVLSHEMAHARPARTAYRMNQIHGSPKKVLREEGRADFESRGHFKKNPQGGYAQAATQRTENLKAKGLETNARKQLKKVPLVGNRLGSYAAKQVRTAAKPMRARGKEINRGMSQSLGKPVGNKEVDAYIGVQNQMKRAKKRG